MFSKFKSPDISLEKMHPPSKNAELLTKELSFIYKFIISFRYNAPPFESKNLLKKIKN